LRSRATRRRRAGGVTALALLALAIGAAPAEAKRDMRCNGAALLCTRHFDRVVLPGAHNAMSAADLGWKIPNQSVAIPEQLETGIRALLIDTHYGRLQPDGTVKTDDNGRVTEGERGLYLCHEVCEIGATPLVPALRQIRKFVRKRPNNVLAIIVEPKVTADDFASAVTESGLIDYVYDGPFGPWPTLRKMIRTHQQVVVLAERDAGTTYPWYQNAYDGILQETPYTFGHASELTDPANWPATCAPNRGDSVGSLFLMNHWSPPTPPAQTDFANEEAVNAKDVILGRARECEALRGRLPSIIAVDQFAIGGLFAAVKELNGVRR
jgi:hypothetical protein